MRSIPPELQTRLETGATKLCRCWRINRPDGATLGFTDHDQDLAFDGAVFLSSSGMTASAVQSATGLSVDNAQAAGALSAESIREEDIRAGKYDSSEILNWLVDWERPDLRVLIFRGHFGEIRRTDGAFEVELRGLAELLNKPVGRSILRRCGRVLGDEKCAVKLEMPKYTTEAEVVSIGGMNRFTIFVATDYSARWFASGTISWLTGTNAGGRSVVKSDQRVSRGSRMVEVWQELPNKMMSGDRMKIVAGCDKLAGTCQSKFNNFLNFRGFPHLPGEDWVTAYPKNGAIHDGASQQR